MKPSKTSKRKTFRKYVNGVSIASDNDPGVLLRHVYDNLYPSLDGPSIAAAVLIVAKYQYQSAFVADQTRRSIFWPLH